MKRLSGLDLSERQLEVLRLVAKGHTNGEIADILGISLAGVKWHVSELLGKFNVETRDELADEWMELASWRARAFALFAGIVTLRRAAAGVAVAALGSGVIVTAGVMAARGGSPADDTSLAGVTATSTATQTATPPIAAATLPAEAPGAVLTADEALRRALAAGNTEIAAGRLGRDAVLQVPRVEDMVLKEARWLPGITRFNSSDGDSYWMERDGNERNVWQFLWEMGGVARAGDFAGTNGKLVVEVLVEDGSDAEPLAFRVFLSDPGDPTRGVGGGGGFWSRRIEEQQRLATEAIGPSVRVAWLNNDTGSAWIAVYPTAAGSWCTENHNANGERAGGGCGFDPDRIPPLSISMAANVSTTGNWTNLTFEMLLQPEAATVRLVYADGHERAYAVVKPPPETGLDIGFLYVTVDTLDAPITVIALDSAGRELAREAKGKPDGPPPPPPQR